jgi:hypothetical protein
MTESVMSPSRILLPALCGKGNTNRGRILKPGGKLFLTTLNYMGLPGLHRIYIGLTGREFTRWTGLHSLTIGEKPGR